MYPTTKKNSTNNLKNIARLPAITGGNHLIGHAIAELMATSVVAIVVQPPAISFSEQITDLRITI